MAAAAVAVVGVAAAVAFPAAAPRVGGSYEMGGKILERK